MADSLFDTLALATKAEKFNELLHEVQRIHGTDFSAIVCVDMNSKAHVLTYNPMHEFTADSFGMNDFISELVADEKNSLEVAESIPVGMYAATFSVHTEYTRSAYGDEADSYLDIDELVPIADMNIAWAGDMLRFVDAGAVATLGTQNFILMDILEMLRDNKHIGKYAGELVEEYAAHALKPIDDEQHKAGFQSELDMIGMGISARPASSVAIPELATLLKTAHEYIECLRGNIPGECENAFHVEMRVCGAGERTFDMTLQLDKTLTALKEAVKACRTPPMFK